MSTVSQSHSVSISVGVYRLLLAAYPKKFREHYEAQMVQVFRDSFRDAYQRGGASGAIDLWLHTFADLFVSALIERVAERSQYMFSPRIIFWGGLAGVFGGLLWCTVLFSMVDGWVTVPAALLLTLAGLAALHARQGSQAGRLSWTGFMLGVVGTAMVLWFFVWDVIPGHPGNPGRDPGAALQFADFALGMGLLGIGHILIGLRMLQTGIPSRFTTTLTIALGALHAGFGTCFWLLYLLMAKGVNAWNPMSAPVNGVLFFSFAMGILWLVLGAILAGQSSLQTSEHPAAPA